MRTRNTAGVRTNLGHDSGCDPGQVAQLVSHPNLGSNLHLGGGNYASNGDQTPRSLPATTEKNKSAEEQMKTRTAAADRLAIIIAAVKNSLPKKAVANACTRSNNNTPFVNRRVVIPCVNHELSFASTAGLSHKACRRVCGWQAKNLRRRRRWLHRLPFGKAFARRCEPRPTIFPALLTPPIHTLPPNICNYCLHCRRDWVVI